MKALAILAVAAAVSLCAPASARVRVFAAGHGPHFAHPHRGFGALWRHAGGYLPENVEAPVGDAAEASPSAPLSAVAFAAVPPAPEGVAAPAAAPSQGPHIIYIGRQPAIHGPKVTYGTP